MKKVSPGHYELEAEGRKYRIDRDDETVIGPSGKEVPLVTWTPLLEGDEKAFGGRSYKTLKEARVEVYDHIRENIKFS